MLLPGPEAQQLAVYIGWLLHKTRGGLVAGTLFVLPGFLAIMALSLVYAAFGQVGIVQALFFGLKAAVLAIVLEAVVRIGKRALKNRVMVGIAAAAFVAIFFLGVPFPLIVLAAALIGYLGGRAGHPAFLAGGGHGPAAGKAVADAETALGEELPAHARPPLAWSLKVAAVCLLLWLGPVVLLLLTLGPGNVFSEIAVFFSKMAVVTFGGAYAVLAYVAQEAVETYGWLQPGEMLDGLGMAETTPGPLIMVVQFVGFMGAFRDPGALPPLLAGALGGLLTTWVTFVPCFLWIFLGAPFVETLRGNKALVRRARDDHRGGGGRGPQPRGLVRAPRPLRRGARGARARPDAGRAGPGQRQPRLARADAGRAPRRVPVQGRHDPGARGVLARGRAPLPGRGRHGLRRADAAAGRGRDDEAVVGAGPAPGERRARGRAAAGLRGPCAPSATGWSACCCRPTSPPSGTARSRSA